MMIDAQQLRQALTNIFQNSVDLFMKVHLIKRFDKILQN